MTINMTSDAHTTRISAHHFAVAFGALAALALVGCVSSTAPPTVEVASVAGITDTSTDGSVMQIELRTTNPNDKPLPLEKVSYRVNFDGQFVFEGVRSAENTLHRLGEQTINLPVVVNAEVMRTALKNNSPFTVSGTMVYVVRGPVADVLFDAGLFRPKQAFSGAVLAR